MFSLLRGHIGAGTIILLISALIRGGSIWMRQQHIGQVERPVPTPSAQSIFKTVTLATPTPDPQPEPTFAVPSALMTQAQAAAPEPTPDAAMEGSLYVESIRTQLKQVIEQLQVTLKEYDDAAAKGEMFAREYNATTKTVANEGRKLHRLANKIREIHAPDRFSTYHANVLEALDTVEETLVTLMSFATDEQELTLDEREDVQQELKSAIEVLTGYPRANTKNASTTGTDG